MLDEPWPAQAQRKKKKDKEKRGLSTAKANPKAFSFQSGRNASKAIRRNADREQKRLHVPLVDRSSAAEEPPPFIVAVTGPPQVMRTAVGRTCNQFLSWTRWARRH